MYVCTYCQHFQQSMGHPGIVANPARGQLNRGKIMFPFPVRVREFGPARQIYSTAQLHNRHTVFVCISLAADAPQLSRPPIATLPSCLWSLGVFPSLPGSRLRVLLSRCEFSTLFTPRQLIKWSIVELHFIICVFSLSSTYGRSQNERTEPVKNRTHDFVLMIVKLRGYPVHSTRATSVYVCVFIEMHITAQSCPVILVILCHSH